MRGSAFAVRTPVPKTSFLGSGGGGGGPGPTAQKQLDDGFFLVLNLFYKGVKWFYYRENYTFQGSRGFNFFEGGGGGGEVPNVNFYRNPYNL